MKVSFCVPEDLRERVGAFLSAEAPAIEMVSDGGGTVRIVQSAERRQSNPTTLQAGGWITCPTARAMAAKLQIDGRKMGKLLDLLDVKVRVCELGCFE